ncbi:hypothetical protein [Anabaena sphaerica]|uniref:hypothetical protein n=1 Tax=Anabaena sphaerica TaxID=212446 RepID=UPI001F54BDE0|nr:hypothetical protein [Anabaena sphaerica]
MQTQAVTETITTIAEAEKQFSLSRSQSQDFFTEWHDQLPEINSSDAYGEAIALTYQLFKSSLQVIDW